MAERRRRLFFALWPERDVRNRCDWYAAGILGKRRRRVPAANLHMTLAFAGAVDERVCRCLEAHADEVDVPAFDMTLDYLGYWERQRILWMGPRHIPEALWELVTSLRTALEACGVPRDRRAWQAHMTLVRRYSTPLPAATAPEIHWPVGRFALLQSVPSDNHAIYKPLRIWTLERG